MLALQCLFPMFDQMRSDEFVGISIVNRDTQAREFTVTAVSPDGASVQTGKISIAPGAQRAQLINQILGTAARPSSGWIRIDSPGQECMTYVASGNEDMLDGGDAPSTTGTSILIPNVSVFTGFVELSYVDTYIAIVNSGATSANVTAQLIG